jgi:hypothetical protein
MQPFDIYNAVFDWHGCQDMRPWLILELRPHATMACFPIASQSYGASAFPLDMSDPDFPATGLKKSCFIIDSHLYDIPLSNFKNPRGSLKGELLHAFRQYAGV